MRNLLLPQTWYSCDKWPRTELLTKCWRQLNRIALSRQTMWSLFLTSSLLIYSRAWASAFTSFTGTRSSKLKTWTSKESDIQCLMPSTSSSHHENQWVQSSKIFQARTSMITTSMDRCTSPFQRHALKIFSKTFRWTRSFLREPWAFTKATLTSRSWWTTLLPQRRIVSSLWDKVRCKMLSLVQAWRCKRLFQSTPTVSETSRDQSLSERLWQSRPSLKWRVNWCRYAPVC